MLSLNEVRNDLKEIKFYNVRRNAFEKALDFVGENQITKKISAYNKAICAAPPKLYDLYVSLYLNNNLQDTYSNSLGYTTEYISRQNTKLIKFFQQNIKEEDFNLWKICQNFYKMP